MCKPVANEMLVCPVAAVLCSLGTKPEKDLFSLRKETSVSSRRYCAGLNASITLMALDSALAAFL